MGAPETHLTEIGNTVLTGRGGRFEVSESERDKVCLMGDGTLYVSQAYKNDMQVLSFFELLKHNKFPYQLKYISIDELQKLYAQASGAATGIDKTFRQNQVVDLIREAVQKRASDIHFRNLENYSEVWMRIDGFMEKVHTYKHEDGDALCATMYGSMCDVADTTYKRGECQDGRLKREFVKSCNLFGVRIATRPLDYGNLFVIRLLYSKDGNVRTLETLGYLPEQGKMISRMVKRTHGINIFTGPTGSGKSTALEVLLDSLLKLHGYSIHLLTIENPPEYLIFGGVQTPLLCDKDDPEAVARAWVRAISSSMRLDPDVMMVGEMVDAHSAIAAFRAAMTGHGLWTTLHANNAIQALDRLMDLGVNRSFATDASLVTGLINQSLAPVNCNCKRPYLKHRHELEPDLCERIERFCTPETVYLRGNDKGCPICRGKGYFGRRAVTECVVPTQGLMNEYRDAGAAAARSYWVKKMDGITKCQHLIQVINSGLIDPSLGELKVCSLDDDLLTIA